MAVVQIDGNLQGQLSVRSNITGSLSNAGNKDDNTGKLPRGGQAGDILMKVSSENYDAAWSKPLSVSLVDGILTFQEGSL